MSIILCYLGKSLTDHNFPGPPKDHLLLAPCLSEPHLTDRRYNFSLENKQKLNINIASYFLETLASPNGKTCLTQEVQLHKQSITFLLILIIGRSVEKTWKTMISSLDKGVKYTGNNETKKHGIPYLISSSYEINLIANSMERHLGLRYTTIHINCHLQTNGTAG